MGPALDADDFTVLGLPRRYALDLADLQGRWKALQARVHPDRFAGAGPDAQCQALQWSIRVNEAHRRLKDPLDRAAALCALNGHPVDAGNTVPPGFLLQQMAWRDTLDEATTPAQVESLAGQVAGERTRRLAVLAALAEAAAWEPAALEIRALMFLQRLAEQVDRRLLALGGD